MQVDLSKPAEQQRATIEHPSFGKFTLLLHALGPEEQAKIDAQEVRAAWKKEDYLAARYLAQLQVLIAGWEDVNDKDGNPIPYSLPTLSRICKGYPALASLVSSTVERYAGGALNEEERKNSPAPSGDDSTTANQDTQSSPSGND